MSLASVHPADLHSCHHTGLLGSQGVSSSLDDLRNATRRSTNNNKYNFATAEHVLTIEELRLQLNSCFTCGVSWAESHISLDCSECGGYPLERPCPLCDGNCNQVWKRDLTTSHACGKARWEGECASRSRPKSKTSAPPPTDTSNSTSTSILASELCARLEKLKATS